MGGGAGGSPVLLKLSVPMRSLKTSPQPPDKSKKGGRERVGSERRGWEQRGETEDEESGRRGRELAASRVIYLPNQDTMSRL